jgi:hypothetical protein
MSFGLYLGPQERIKAGIFTNPEDLRNGKQNAGRPQVISSQ